MSTNNLKSIADIFERRIFRIPDYQRGYSWEDKHLNEFWEDLELLPDDQSHYMGVLTLESVPREIWENWEDDIWLLDKVRYKPYFIVDGQQRLLTIAILLFSIFNQLDDDKELNFTSKSDFLRKYISITNESLISFILGYESDNPSYEFLKTEIFEAASNQNRDIQTIYTLNLKNAKFFFTNKIEDLDSSQLEELVNKICHLLKFNMYFIEEAFEVFVAFETMNNRGKSLSTLELLKNRLIYLSTRIPDVDDDQKKALRKNINESWKTVYEYLGKNPNNPLKDDIFLKNHWTMYYHYSRKQAKEYAKYLLNDQFTIKRAISQNVSLKSIQEYISSIQKSVKFWFFINNPENLQLSQFDYDQLAQLKELLYKLKRLSYGAFRPLILASFHQENPNEIIELLEAIEDFLFTIFKISQRRANTGDSIFYKLARDLFKNKITTEHALHEIRRMGRDYWSYERFEEFISDKFKFTKNGFYGWKGLSYFLYEYEIYLRERSQNIEYKIKWEEFTKIRANHVTIEHIAPRSNSNPDWVRIFNQFSEDERLHLIHSLGNLLALSMSKNSSLQDKSFAIKKREGNTGYYNGSYSEIEVAQYTQWTADEILERGLLMIDFMCERWGIEMDREAKIKILHLEFLEP